MSQPSLLDIDDPTDVLRTADLSDDGVYRYRLTRVWGAPSALLGFIMLNPSTADALQDDPTIRRCIGFARDMGHGGVVVANLYALRATQPADLWKSAGPTGGRRNDDVLRQVLATTEVVIAAWGAHAKPDRVDWLLRQPDPDSTGLVSPVRTDSRLCNFQRHCHRAIYVGVGFKFNDFYQSLHRIHRYLQDQPVRIDIIHTTAERHVVRALKAKWAQHEELTATMTDVIRKHGLARTDIADALTRAMGVERIEASGEGWTLANNDCVPETESMDEGSVDLIVTSIPFSNHYEYTPSYNDFGHTDDNDHFWAQMDYLTPQLHRVLAPGRIYACHVKDRINFGNVTGAGIPTVSPFHAEALFHGVKHGFDYMGMITVVTDVVRENNQTYRLGWTEMTKDGSKMGVGSPEYVLLFHKPQSDRTKGYADERIVKDKADYSRARWQIDAHAFWRSSGDRPLTPEELEALPIEQRSRLFTEQTLAEVYDYESHVRIGEALDGRGALPATFMSLAPGSWHKDVWHDVNRMRTLNGEQSRRVQQFHVCPLQYDIVDRLIRRYSNEGDLVYDPFGGLMTVPLRALKLGRRGRGVELNTGYFLDGVKYLEAAERDRDLPSLFDLTEEAS